MKKRNSDVLLGVIFFGALIGLGVVTIMLSDFAIGVPRYEIEMYADDIGYLRPGDPVLIHGMAAGKVLYIERLTNPLPVSRPLDSIGESPGDVLCTIRIVCKLDVNPFEFLRTDYRVLIEERGLLGGKLIRIEVGANDEEAVSSRPLLAEAPPGAIQSAGRILEENREPIRRTVEYLEQVAEKANSADGTIGLLLQDAETRDKVSQIVDDLQEVGAKMSDGEGTLGKLLTDTGPFDDFKVAAADIRSFTDEIKRGEGTLGKLVQDDAVYEDARLLIADVREGLNPVWDAEGTLGKLINEDVLHADAEALIADLREIADKASDGEGTVAKLLNDDELYDTMVTLVQDASDFFGDVQDGDGLLAAIIQDEEMAEDFRSLLSQALGAIEDARETTPVTSLGSFLFGTF